MPSTIRMRGLFQVAWATVLLAALAGVVYGLDVIGWHHIPWEFAIPAGFVLAGLLQAITGVPFAHFASRWDGLQPWQRGVFGVALVLASCVVVFAAAWAYIAHKEVSASP